MSSKEYWEQRERENLKHYINDEAEYSKKIREIYDEMLVATQAEIDAFYRKYAKGENITIAEAKKRVSRLDIKDYERKAKRYVKNKDFSKEANEQMRLYNLTMKVNRLEMLKANIGLELLKGTSKLERFFADILHGRTMKELERQAGILGKTIQNNAELAHSIVNASFHNATFSQRLWMYNNAMKADIDKLITSGLISGKNGRELAKGIRKYYIGEERLKNGKKGSIFYTERLMRTELARVQTDAQKRSFEKNGFELYRFHVNGGCCPICADVAKKDSGYGKGIYRLTDLMAGTNAAPMHPFCRCAISPYEDSDEYEAWLDFLDNGGTTEEWNAYGKSKWMHIGKNIVKPIENSMNSDIIKKTGLMKLNLQFFASKEKQFGKKIGKHARDYGMNPSVKEDREKMKEIIDSIVKGAEQIKIGSWRGYDDEVLFYIKGEDVVITTQEHEFVTILKGGVSNGRVKIARDK